MHDDSTGGTNVKIELRMQSLNQIEAPTGVAVDVYGD